MTNKETEFEPTDNLDADLAAAEAEATAEAEAEFSAEPASFYSEFGPEENEEPTPEERIEALEAEVDDLKDRILRAVAEAENTRRRGERERENGRRYASENLARDILSVMDNLGRALDSVNNDPAAKEEGPFKTFVDGVVMTEKELLNAFDRQKIEILDPLGEPFDPNLHQAMFEAPSAEHEAGLVMQVIGKGYKLHDRLLRPAMVGVSKGEQ
jgi:molecular chaperone GrpE